MSEKNASKQTHSPFGAILVDCLFACAAVLFCILAACALGRIGREAPFLVFLPGVLLTLWCRGFRSALLSTVLGALTVDYFLIPPIYHFRLGIADIVKAILFISSLGLASWAIDRHRVRIEKAVALRDRLLDSSLEPILITDVQHRVIYWNAGATRIYGWEFEEARGKLPAELLATVYPEPPENIERQLRTVGSWRGMLIRRAKAGAEVVTDSCWTLDEGSGVILQTDMDVTERVRAEKQVQQSSAKLKAALDSMTDAFFICGRDGELIDFNEGFATFHRFASKQQCPKVLSELRSKVELFLPGGDSAPLDQRPVPRALGGETVAHAEYLLGRNDTGERWTGSYCFAPVRDQAGEIVAAVVNARDITQLKHMENELKRLNRTLSVIRKVSQALIQSRAFEEHDLLNKTVELIVAESDYRLAWIGIAERDSERSIKAVASSGQAVAYLRKLTTKWGNGPLREGPVGTALRDRRIVIVRDCRSNPSYQGWGPLAEEFGFRSVIALPLMADGQVIAVLAVYSGQTDAFDSEEVALLSGMADDISFGISAIRNRKLAETERQTRLQLELQLQQAQKLEAIGTLAGGIAHDFNNLLMVIMAQLELLLPKLDAGLLPRAHVVMQSAKRAADLTSQLLAFSRRQVTQPAVISLNEVLGNLKEMMTHLVREDVEVRTVTCDRPWPVRIDRSQFEQVIMNLIVNARDAMPNGGLLTIETANADIGPEYHATHPLVPSGRYAMLAVSDNGAGMSPEIKARVFEPFFTTKEPGRGTGLGLAVVYGIIKQANGFIWVYSELGEGTCFKIYLPIAQPDESAEKESTEAMIPRPTRRTTVLLVEDDPNLRDSIAEFLESGGHAVIAAESAQEACRLANACRGAIEILLTDVVLKGGNGKHLAKSIEETGCHFKVIYMSGYTPSAIVHHGVLDPGTRFLQKPFSREELLKMIEITLQE